MNDMLPRAVLPPRRGAQPSSRGGRIYGGFMAENKNNKFEDNLAELTALVQKLESDLPLDQAIAAFEKGIALTKVCLEELKAEKGKLALLTDDLNKITEEFDLEK